DETSGPRFDIREYTQAASEVAAAAHELSALTERADTLLPTMRQASDEMADRIKQIQDRLFLELLLLVVAAIAASLLAALVYRAVVARIQKHDTRVRAAR